MLRQHTGQVRMLRRQERKTAETLYFSSDFESRIALVLRQLPGPDRLCVPHERRARIDFACSKHLIETSAPIKSFQSMVTRPAQLS